MRRSKNTTCSNNKMITTAAELKELLRAVENADDAEKAARDLPTDKKNRSFWRSIHYGRASAPTKRPAR